MTFMIPTPITTRLPKKIKTPIHVGYQDETGCDSQDHDEVEYDPLSLPLLLFPPTLQVEIKNDTSSSSSTRITREKKRGETCGSKPRKEKETSASGFFELQMINQTQFSFEKVGGFEEIKQELYQLKDMMTNCENYSKWNVRIPRGLLLYGSPGSGKTFLAKCFAGECQLGFIAVSGSEFQEKYVGVGQSRIRELFQFARQQAPCIIFIDEIDAVARQRSGEGETAQAERDATVNQLLVEMDGVTSRQDNSQVFVIGSTNRKDVLDPALLRAGRMDKKLLVPPPCERVRKQIVNIHLVDKPIRVNETWVASELTQGMNGAQIEHLLNEASLFGIRHNMLPVNETLLEKIHEMIQLGLPSEYLMTPFPPKPFDVETGYRIAVHEMGHVVMALLSSTHDQPVKCTIESPSIEMLGYTVFQKPVCKNVRNVRDFLVTKEELIDQIGVLLGGRIAEEILIGSSSISSGASADLQRVRKIVYDMILQYGMGSKCIYPFHGDIGKSQIDQMASRIIHQTYEHTKQKLQRYQNVLKKMSQILVDEKTMYYEQLYPLFLELSQEDLITST